MKKKTGKRVLSTTVALFLRLSTLGIAQEPAGPISQRAIVHAGRLLNVRSGKTLTDQAIVIERAKSSASVRCRRRVARPAIV